MSSILRHSGLSLNQGFVQEENPQKHQILFSQNYLKVKISLSKSKLLKFDGYCFSIRFYTSTSFSINLSFFSGFNNFLCYFIWLI